MKERRKIHSGQLAAKTRAFQRCLKTMMVSSSSDGGSGSSANRWPLGYTGEKGLWLLVAAMEVVPVGCGVKWGGEVHGGRNSKCGLVVGGSWAVVMEFCGLSWVLP